MPSKMSMCARSTALTHSSLIPGRCIIVSMADGRPVDAAMSFAGQAAPYSTASAPGGPLSLLGPCTVPLASGVASVSWWGPRALAVASVSGAVAVARLPGATSILGDVPLGFSPGVCVAACSRTVAGAAPGTAGDAKGLLVLEPWAGGQRRGPGRRASSGGGDARDTSGAAEARGQAARIPDTPTGEGGPAGARGAAGWLASKLGVLDEVADSAAAAAGSSEGGAASEQLLKGWQLVLLAERTPAQMVQVHLREHDWGSALQLCKVAGIHPDTVYRARWAAAPVSRENIQVREGVRVFLGGRKVDEEGRLVTPAG